MKQGGFYHQLGVYLLVKDANTHHGAMCSAVGFIHNMASEATQHAIGERMERWFGEYLYNEICQQIHWIVAYRGKKKKCFC